MLNEDLPTPSPIRESGIPLDADMIFGWKPARSRRGPILLSYNARYPTAKQKLLYKGCRPHNSYAMHTLLNYNTYQYKEPDSVYAHLSHTVGKPQDKLGMLTEGPIFNSQFECGNLDKVYRCNETEYDLYMRCDTNTKGYLHWFYFSVTGVPKGKTLKFNIVNFSRQSNLYYGGMKIRVYSDHKPSKGWENSKEILYFGNSKLKHRKQFFQLSFEYKFFHERETVWFATSVPYSYGKLQNLLDSFETQRFYTKKHLETTILVKSLSLLEVPLLTITNPKVPYSKKRCILVVGRAHPAETVGSWVMEGFLKFLLTRNHEASYLKKNFVFKIVPMLNVDGVVVGNSRTSLVGKDLNRNYFDPDPEFFPTIHALKAMARSLGNKLYMFFDIHGHFCKKGSFIYGPHFPLHHSNYYKAKIIPKLMSERTDIFRYYSCRYNEETRKLGAGRIVMTNEFGIQYSFTLETSYNLYIHSNRETKTFKLDDLLSIGSHLATSIYEFDTLMKQQQKPNLNTIRFRTARKTRSLTHKLDEEEKTQLEFIKQAVYKPHPDRKLEDLIRLIKQDEDSGQLDSSFDSSQDSDTSENSELIRQTLPAVKMSKTDKIEAKRISSYLPKRITDMDSSKNRLSKRIADIDSKTSPNEPKRYFKKIEAAFYQTETALHRNNRSKTTIPNFLVNSVTNNRKAPNLTPKHIHQKLLEKERAQPTKAPYLPQYFKMTFVNTPKRTNAISLQLNNLS